MSPSESAVPDAVTTSPPDADPRVTSIRDNVASLVNITVADKSSASVSAAANSVATETAAPPSTVTASTPCACGGSSHITSADDTKCDRDVDPSTTQPFARGEKCAPSTATGANDPEARTCRGDTELTTPGTLFSTSSSSSTSIASSYTCVSVAAAARSLALDATHNGTEVPLAPPPAGDAHDAVATPPAPPATFAVTSIVPNLHVTDAPQPLSKYEPASAAHVIWTTAPPLVAPVVAVAFRAPPPVGAIRASDGTDQDANGFAPTPPTPPGIVPTFTSCTPGGSAGISHRITAEDIHRDGADEASASCAPSRTTTARSSPSDASAPPPPAWKKTHVASGVNPPPPPMPLLDVAMMNAPPTALPPDGCTPCSRAGSRYK
eukprot:29989-Pelagococcus_subviridis.AAC.5